MKKLIRALAIVPVLCTSPLTAIANTAGMSITGIIPPATCTPSFSDGGVVDHGSINPVNLSPSEFNILQSKSVQLSIACDAPAVFAITMRDNRGSSVPTGIEATLNGPATAMLGLGTVGGKSIGAYMLSFAEDGFAFGFNPVSRATSSGTWAALTDHRIVVDPTIDQQYSGAFAGETEPRFWTLVRARITIDTALNRANDLPSLSNDVILDGSATLTVFHL